MHASLMYWSIYIFPIATFVGLGLGGIWSFLTVICAFIGVTILDGVLGANSTNTPVDQEQARVSETAFDLPMVTWVPVQALTLLGVAAYVSYGPVTTLEAIGLTLSAGVVAGAGGITIAHELIHRRDQRSQKLGRALLIMVMYSHWAVEHIRGHHLRAATPQDPATSRYGESVYAFIPRTIFGAFQSAWQLESNRRIKRGKPVWSLDNQLIKDGVIQVAILLGVGLVMGWTGVWVWLGQAAFAVILLEVINYLEHYGLTRTQKPDGKWTPVTPAHSWNSSHTVSNWLLFSLGRHSDHHANASRAYPILQHIDEAPQLPTGYAGMLLLALVPPLWFRVMNPRVDAWRNAQLQTATG